MLKRLTFSFVLILFVSVFSLGVSSANTSYGSNWETTCDEGLCQTTIYSYEKYWRNGDNWEQIDEGFSDCSDNEMSKYCTQDYRFNVVADDNGSVSAYLNNDEFTVQLSDLLGKGRNFNPVISGNEVTYKDVVQGVDLRYSYLPTLLKEEIIINEPIQGLPDRDFDISFNKRGNADFGIEESIICDANGLCQKLQHSVERNRIILTIPGTFLNNPEVEYPVVIDPSVNLDDNSIIWDGYVTKESGTPNIYTRTNSSAGYIKTGYLPTFGGTKLARGDIDWNVSAIPDGSVIYNLTLQLYATTSAVGSPTVLLNVTHMEGNSISYGDNSTECYGNCNFWEDMFNGTVYYEDTSFQTDQLNEINLEQAISDLEGSLSSDIFSTGLVGYYQMGKEVRIASKYYTNSTFRPKLTIVYTTDAVAPSIEFVSPTPENGANLTDSVYVNLSTSDSGDHYSFVDFAGDLLLWLRGDDTDGSTLIDLSSHGLDGSLEGDAAVNDSGIYGRMMNFDAGGDYIYIPASENALPSEDFTLSAWVKPPANVSGDNYRTIMSTYTNYQGSNKGGYGLRMITNGTDTNDLDFFYYNGSNYVDVVSDSPLYLDDWNLATVTYDGQTVRVYIDGIVESIHNISGSITPLNDLYLGTLNFSSLGLLDYWNGSIDDVLVFDRALSQQEVFALRNSSKANYQYEHNFTNIGQGLKSFTGYAVDFEGNRNQTEERIVNILDEIYPSIYFGNQTPEDDSDQQNKDIFVDLVSSDLSDHYSFLNFDNNLNLWMRMDDINGNNLSDLSNYGFTGILNGDALVSASGKYGKSLSLDAEGDYVYIPASKSDLPQDTFTISSWIKPVSDISGDNYRTIMSTYTTYQGTSKGGYGIRLISNDTNSGKPEFFYYNGSKYISVISNSTVLLDSWNLLTVTFDGNTVKVYLDGDLTASDSVEGSITSLSDIYLGTLNFSTSGLLDYWNGSLDESFIFQRDLSQDEIKSLYNAGITQYSNNFSSLSDGLHSFTGYAVDGSGNLNQTETRSVSIRRSPVEYNLSYDENGNLIQGFDKYFEYDGFNRLSSIRANDSDGQLIEQYFYDSEGNRIIKVFVGETENTTTYYVNENFVQVVNSSGIFNYSYYYANNKLLASKNSDDSKLFYHPDHLGSNTLITDENGDVVEKTSYLPYGEVESGGEDSRYLYNSKELDRQTDLYYYGARYYDPEFSHFVQPDSVIADVYNPQDLNGYNYVRNNPYTYVDPSGNLPYTQAFFEKYIPGYKAASDFVFELLPFSGVVDVVDDVSSGNVGTGTAVSAGTVVLDAFGIGLVSDVGKIPKLVGGANPIVKEAAKVGRDVHKAFNYGEGFEKEVKIGSNRLDALKIDNENSVGYIKELKPNNPRAIARGESQLNRYLKAAQAKFPNIQKWITEVVTYD